MIPCSVWTFHEPSGRCLRSWTGLFLTTSAPWWIADFAYALVTPDGSTLPSAGSYSAPRYSSVLMSGLRRFTSSMEMKSASIPMYRAFARSSFR